MAQIPSNPFGYAPGLSVGYRSREEELSVGQFFNAVYAWMCVGLATTAAVAYGVYAYAPQLMTPGIGIGSAILSLVLVVTIRNAVNRVPTPLATALFVLYSGLVGVMFSVLFAVYAHVTLGVVFLETAGLFGTMSVFGYVTKRDLSRLSSFLYMALFGLVIASVVNVFLHSPGLYWVVSYAGILLFVGLTAADTQQLKSFALQTGNSPELARRVAIIGSLTLYLDFINLFLFMLRVMGGNGRRD